MDLFRRQQKVIFWIVTIIIVPSFVMVWGVGGRYFRGQGEMPDIGRVDGQTIGFQDFDAFRKRLQAAVGGLPLQVAGAPGGNSQAGELYWKYLFAYAILKDAERADTRVSSLQVGTYVENLHPVLRGAKKPGDAQAFNRAVDSFCAQAGISRAEFLKGVREWECIRNYLMADANLAAVNDDTVFAFHAVNRGECVVRKVRVVRTESLLEQAKLEISRKSPEELEDAARAYASGKSSDERYRQPAGWRFAYIHVPFAPVSEVARPGEAEIESAYEAGRSGEFQGKTLDEAREAVTASLLRREALRQTYRNLRVDVDPQLASQAENLDLSELVKLAQLARYGVTAGDTGPELLDRLALAEKLPSDPMADLGFTLDWLDRNPAGAGEGLEAWKKGFNLEGNPFTSDTGLFRLRLLDYRPSSPLPLDNPDGSIRQDILTLALADMAGDRADELVRERAEDMKGRLMALMEARERGGEPPDRELADDFDRLPEESLAYMSLGGNSPLIGMTVGDLMDPAPFENPESGESGLEITVLTGRRIPSRSAFFGNPGELEYSRRAVANFFVGNAEFNYAPGSDGLGFQPTEARIQPSPAVMGSLSDRLIRGDIFLDPVWTRENQSGG